MCNTIRHLEVFPKSIRLFEIRVDCVSRHDVLKWATQRIQAKSVSNYVVALNVAKVVKARQDPRLAAIIGNADLVTADGIPIVWASRLSGPRLPERVTGIDIMFDLLREGDKRSWSFYFLGAMPNVIEAAVEKARKQFPGIQVAGFRDGYFSLQQEVEVVRQIAASKANVLFLGFGSPKKENFVDRWRNKFEVNIIHGVGGSFNVFVGKTMRAPRWMQNAGLEWLFRLLQEPVRMFPRYAVTNTIFLGLVIREILTKVKGNRDRTRSERG